MSSPMQMLVPTRMLALLTLAPSDSWETGAMIIRHPLPSYLLCLQERLMGMHKVTNFKFHAYSVITDFTTWKSSNYSMLPLK